MLLKSHHDSEILIVGDQTFTAVAPGIFEVPEAIGRMLIAFPHFEEHVLPLENDQSNAADVAEEQPVEAKEVKPRSRKKKV